MEPLATIEAAFHEFEEVIDALRRLRFEEADLDRALRRLEHEDRIRRRGRLDRRTLRPRT